MIKTAKGILVKFIKAAVVGNARVTSYENIVEAQKQRDLKEAAAEAFKSRRQSKRGASIQVLGMRSRDQEKEAEHEIRALGLAQNSSVVDFILSNVMFYIISINRSCVDRRESITR